MSMHISANPGEIAPSVVLPGDPLRAKHMAETYLENAVLINEIRGILGYTGSYRGRPVTVMATGMGVPSMVIYATELCRDYGCRRLVRIGTGGACRADIRPGDIVLSMATSTTSAINDYILPGRYAPTADFELLYRAHSRGREMGLAMHVGNTLCNDHLYIDNKIEYIQKWAEYGVIASEMEGAGLYTVAARYGAQAVMMISIGTNLLAPGITVSSEQKERGLGGILELAIETAIEP